MKIHTVDVDMSQRAARAGEASSVAASQTISNEFFGLSKHSTFIIRNSFMEAACAVRICSLHILHFLAVLEPFQKSDSHCSPGFEFAPSFIHLHLLYPPEHPLVLCAAVTEPFQRSASHQAIL